MKQSLKTWTENNQTFLVMSLGLLTTESYLLVCHWLLQSSYNLVSCEYSNRDFALLRIINIIINVFPHLYLKVSFVSLCRCVKFYCNEDKKWQIPIFHIFAYEQPNSFFFMLVHKIFILRIKTNLDIKSHKENIF